MEKTVSDKHGKLIQKVWKLEGFILGYVSGDFTKLSPRRTQRDEERIQLHFGTKGDYCFKHFQLQKEFDLIGGHHNLMYSNGFEIEVFPKTAKIETFGLSFEKSYFLNLFEKPTGRLEEFIASVCSGKAILFSPDWGSISSPIQRILNQIKNHGFIDGLEKVYLQAKGLELLTLCLAQYENNQWAKKLIKTPLEKSRIIAARDILMEDLQHPPTLSQLSKKTGLNEFKLKNGFKEVFGTTVFAYLLDQKLQLAFQLLHQSSKTAAEISLETGFSSPQHFSHAFKKRFGRTPKSIIKNPSDVTSLNLKAAFLQKK